MNAPNESQKRIAETLEGFLAVDAGPGTGKTRTIVERFVNILEKGVSADRVLLLTFTRNAAEEMKERIKNALAEIYLSCGSERRRAVENASKVLQTGTFDSFCHTIVTEYPEAISRFFGIDGKLSRGAVLSENETLNREYFNDVADRFLFDRCGDYGDAEAVVSQHIGDAYTAINAMMSAGIFPLKKGWFGSESDPLTGDAEAVADKLRRNREMSNKKEYRLPKDVNQVFKDIGIERELPTDSPLAEDVITEAVEDDRTDLFRVFHDLYYHYIKRSVEDDRLTFSLTSLFAFVVLYSEKGIREGMSFDYLMIDEFQDTDSNQLRMALMLLDRPNLCVVGDWKQGIYGFRNAEIENMTEFHERVPRMVSELNDDTERVRYRVAEEDIMKMHLDVNYRSSSEIIGCAYRSLTVRASSQEELDTERIRGLVGPDVYSDRDGAIGDRSHVRFVKADNVSEETEEVVRRILDYATGDGYGILCDDGTFRRPSFGDIAVLCRGTRACIEIYEAARGRVPVFMQGDMEIMSTREGKLLLAWLKYVNNRNDRWGLSAILSDTNLAPREVRSVMDDMRSDDRCVPEMIREQRDYLRRKRRRITELVTSVFSLYGIDNDISHAITSVVSSAHRNSLLTISDIIRMMESDISNGTRYRVESVPDGEAVIIQTIHKSKGLEYPIVMIPRVDSRVFPSTVSDRSAFLFDRDTGLRCTKELYRFGEGYAKIDRSWKTHLVKRTLKKEYDEERRLLFVALSRAKQYVTVSASDPSFFFKELSGGESVPSGLIHPGEAEVRKESPARAPDVGRLPPRRLNVGVHDILRFGDDEPGGEPRTPTAASADAMRFGTAVHECAERMVLGKEVEEEYPQIAVVRAVLDSLEDASEMIPEIECALPFNDLNVTLRGIIDLLVLYPDRVEIHDWKTDRTRDFEGEYMIQLSIYAHAASGHYGLPAVCCIDYVTLDEQHRFQPLPEEDIATRVRDYLEAL